MDSGGQTKILTAATTTELAEKVKALEADIIEQGWHAEGAVISNDDGSYSQKMVRNSS